MIVTANIELGRKLIHRTAQIQTHETRQDLLKALRGAHLSGQQLIITDLEMFRSLSLPLLAANVADFGPKSASESVRALSAWIITEAAQQLGAKLASPQEVYEDIAEGRITRQMSFPAVNVRGNSLDTARALFRAAIDNNVGALIIEIARSEMGYTNQAPREFAAVVQAAAMMEGFTGPLFLQGDHIQLKAKDVRAGGAKTVRELATHATIIRDLLESGFGSIDLDMSPFEKRTEENLSHLEQQLDNARLTAGKIRDVRLIEAKLGRPWITLLGGETGEVGKMNTRPEDVDAYAVGILANMEQLGISSALGIRKLAVNDGTSHGGIPGPDGKVIEVAIAFEVLRMATDRGRKFGWAGSVQHGASTLPEDMFRLFPEHGAVEVHLATGFQNVLFKHMCGVGDFQTRAESLMVERFGKERKPGQTDAQFFYSTRKQVIGPMKHELWTMPEEVRAAVAAELYSVFSFLFGQLGVVDTRDLVAQHTTIHEFHLPYPEAAQKVVVEIGAKEGSEGLSD